MGHRILVVEDDTSMRENMVMFLETAGYQVTQAPDGETALALLLDTPGHDGGYAVVVTDIIMGHVDGIEVMEAAKRQDNPPEVILLTGHGSLETAMIAVRTHAFDYLLKPCRITTLLERVAAAVARHDEQERSRLESERGRKLAELANEILLEGPPPPAAAPAASPPAPAAPRTGPPRYLNVGPLRIDTHRHEAWFQQTRIALTATEYAVLTSLATRPGCVHSFADITRHTHGVALERSDAQQLLGTHIRNLRRKLDPRCIVSVRGVGYMLVDPNEKKP